MSEQRKPSNGSDREMKTQLIAAKTNGGTDYLLLKDGQVVSRWAELTGGVEWDRLGRCYVYTDIADWDDQSAAGHDLSDYQDDLDAGRLGVEVLAVEIDGRLPRHLAQEAVGAALDQLDLPAGMHTCVSYVDAVSAVTTLLETGYWPEWFGGINFYALRAARRAARNLGLVDYE